MLTAKLNEGNNLQVKVKDLCDVLQRYHRTVLTCVSNLKELQQRSSDNSRYANELLRQSSYSHLQPSETADLRVPFVALTNAYLHYEPNQSTVCCFMCSHRLAFHHAVALIGRSSGPLIATALHHTECPLAQLVASQSDRRLPRPVDIQLVSFCHSLFASESLNSPQLELLQLDMNQLRHVDLCTYDSSKFVAASQQVASTSSGYSFNEFRSCLRKQRYGRPPGDAKDAAMATEQKRLETFAHSDLPLMFAFLLAKAGLYLVDLASGLRCAFCRKTFEIEWLTAITQDVKIKALTNRDRAYFAAALRHLAILHGRFRARCPIVMNVEFDNVAFTVEEHAKVVERLRSDAAEPGDLITLPKTTSAAESESSMQSVIDSTSQTSSVGSSSQLAIPNSSMPLLSNGTMGQESAINTFSTLSYVSSANEELVTICKSPSTAQLMNLASLAQGASETPLLDLTQSYIPQYRVETHAEFNVTECEWASETGESEAYGSSRCSEADYCSKQLDAYRAGPEFSNERARLETFTNASWDEKASQRPSSKCMSAAGFYMASAAPITAYANSKMKAKAANGAQKSRYAFGGERRHTQLLAEDATLCFSCGGVLSNWLVSDDAFVRHAYNFPDCAHVLKAFGRRFVHDVQLLRRSSGSVMDSLLNANYYWPPRGFFCLPDEGVLLDEKLIAAYADLPAYRYAAEQAAVSRKHVVTVVEETLARRHVPPTKAFEVLELLGNLKTRLRLYSLSIDAYRSLLAATLNGARRGNAPPSGALPLRKLLTLLQLEGETDRAKAFAREAVCELRDSVVLTRETLLMNGSRLELTEELQTCVCCQKAEVEYVLDCRHVVCEKCKRKLGKNCPVTSCRQRIKKPKKVVKK